MNLVIDIGNTAAKIAVFDGEEVVCIRQDSNRSLEHLASVVSTYPVKRGILSSVVTLTEEVRSQVAATGIPMLLLNGETPLPIANLYKTPHTLGSDRLAAVVAANHLQPGCDCLVIDAGTCITYDFIDAAGNYHGGNISPGMHMRLKALHEFTDKLPLVAHEGENPTWGASTETAIRAGVRQGICLEIEGYIRRERAKHPSLPIFLTGGDGIALDAQLESTLFTDKSLVLKGLNRILEYNNETLS